MVNYKPFVLGSFLVPALNKCYITLILISTSIRGSKKPLPENEFYKKKNRYADYLLLATLASLLAFVGAVLFEFVCRDIFVGFYHIFQL